MNLRLILQLLIYWFRFLSQSEDINKCQRAPPQREVIKNKVDKLNKGAV